MILCINNIINSFHICGKGKIPVHLTKLYIIEGYTVAGYVWFATRIHPCLVLTGSVCWLRCNYLTIIPLINHYIFPSMTVMIEARSPGAEYCNYQVRLWSPTVG